MTVALTGMNPNDIFPRTVWLVREAGILLPSRNGTVLECPTPVSVRFECPTERVLFHSKRRINPFLHFFEPFWILAGRDDVAFLENIVPKFANYSDDGQTLYGAYGARIKEQIPEAIKRLKKDPYDRRVVLQIRQPNDIFYDGKDMPCNTSIALKIRQGKLNMHVFNRSNDVVWGGPAGGSNYPQFTVLQEYLAGKIGCAMGSYTVTTDCLHAYMNPQWELLKDVHIEHDPYRVHSVHPFDMMADAEGFDTDLRLAFEGSPTDLAYQSVFFRHVYQPMWESFLAYKEKDYEKAYALTSFIAASDWRDYTEQWLYHFIKKAVQ